MTYSAGKAARRVLAVTLALAALSSHVPTAAAAKVQGGPLAWPPITQQTRPWTRWWWPGSAVDKPNLKRLLTMYRKAGEGGVEITPIYGAHGYESRFIDYLSPQWMDMLAYTTTEARHLGLGVDLTTGTGWPNGGPNVTPQYASSSLLLQRYDVAGGTTFSGPVMPARRGRPIRPPQQEWLQCLEAVSADGQQVNLTAQVQNGQLTWAAPPGQWRLYAVANYGPVQQVKRAAPGGAGSVLDPFSVGAMNHYLARYDQAFVGYRGLMPRSFFHDSYEYFGADWSPNFFAQFQRLRGYDLRTQLPALFGEGPADTVARVMGDYRETISDLHLAYIARWTQWAHSHGSLTREQAHGSPTDIEDTYAAADIPETETTNFTVSENDIPLNKMASSAAHLTGRTLSSSESFTWLTEHFHASLTAVKQAADFLFLTGVNHIFFHGTPYSPADAPWPGWQFYAAVNFGPEGGLWRNLPAFNAYVAHCQSILQSGRSANDVLIYNPVFDVWDAPGERIIPNPMPPAYTDDAHLLWARGYAYDALTDRFLALAKCVNGRVVLGGNPYHVILVPQCHSMPVATLQKLVTLAKSGATIVVQGGLPSDVPGLENFRARQTQLRTLLSTLHPITRADGQYQRAAVGKGAFLIGTNVEAMLRAARVPREPCVDQGLRFVRRTQPGGYNYFLANRSRTAVDGWVRLGLPAKSAVILDPLAPAATGVAALRLGKNRLPEVYLQLPPGASCFVRTFTGRSVTGPRWADTRIAGAAQPVTGTWRVQFIHGGPALPAPFQTRTLASWATLGGADARRFAGTARYTVTFDRPHGAASDWLLDLGGVADSARVTLNGHAVGTLWCAPFQKAVGQWLVPGKNTLVVEVTNLAANRVAFMDRHGIPWKIFYDANVASKFGGALNAANWPLMDSGLLGPVQLVPLTRFRPVCSR